MPRITELERDLSRELETYRKALQGIASCATVCKCCGMHARIAREVLDAFRLPAEQPESD